jgi:C4-dicarboxylate-specific signal transduction histidine kinase
LKDIETPVAFMGRMTAGVTHELRNVLGIIRESAGLIEDLISFSKGASFPAEDKVSKALGRIAEQVDRGTALTGALNRFAHTPDQPRAEVDLNHTVDLAVVLTQRFTRMKGVALEARPSELPVLVFTDPVGVIMLINRVVDLVAEAAGQGATLVLSARRSPEGPAVVDIAASDATPAGREAATSPGLEDAWAAVDALAQSLNATLARGVPLTSCRVVIGKL